jgi:DeoR family ulaG and ulaABCDEF operon transcriptional repressor
MNRTKREHLILTMLHEKAFLSVREICLLVQASESTVRKDISRLYNDARLTKVFGGVASIEESDPKSEGQRVRTRSVNHTLRSKAIAETAAHKCREGDIVGIHGRGLAILLAKALIFKAITVVTSSLNVAMILKDRPNVKILLTGTNLYNEDMLMHNVHSNEIPHYINKCFIEFSKVSVSGISDKSQLYANLGYEMAQKSDHVFLNATPMDHYDIGRFHMLDWSMINAIFLAQSNERQVTDLWPTRGENSIITVDE